MAKSGHPRLGFIGLGEMGAPVVANLLQAGYTVTGFDLDAERLQGCVEGGMEAGVSGRQVVDVSDIVLTSLPSSDAFVAVAEGERVAFDDHRHAPSFWNELMTGLG